MKTYSKTLLALAAVGAFSANASIIQIDFGSGDSNDNVSFTDLDANAINAKSYIVDTDNQAGYNTGDLIVDSGYQLFVGGFTTPDNISGNFFTSGGAPGSVNTTYGLELNYLVWGQAIVDSGFVLPNFTDGIFNVFLTEQNGTRTGLAASFDLQSYQIEAPSTSTSPQIRFNGNLIEASGTTDAENSDGYVTNSGVTNNNQGSFSDMYGTTFAEILQNNGLVSFSASLDFVGGSEIALLSDFDTTSETVQDLVDDVNRYEGNGSDDQDCVFGACSEFIVNSSNAGNDTRGSDYLWDDFRRNILDPLTARSDNVATRAVALASDDIVINANAPATMGVLGAGLLALAGLRRRKS